MKKLCLLAAFSALLFALPFYSYSAEVREPKEFIGEEAPVEIVTLIYGGITEAKLKTEKPISTGRVPGVYDFKFKEFDVIVNTDKGEVKDLVRVLEEHVCSKDDKGILMPWTCEALGVAVVFVEQKISWFKSVEVKKIFEEATR